jgi:YHS domain-containing protein
VQLWLQALVSKRMFGASRKCATEGSQSTLITIYLDSQAKENLLSSTTVAKAPVCGMEIDTATTAAQAGQTYSFCSYGCKEKFDETLAR